MLASITLLTSSAHDVALLGDPPEGDLHVWASQWLGIYVQAPYSANGRPTFVKRGDGSQHMFATAAGHWQVGRLGDIHTGWGLFAAHDNTAPLPDAVNSTWKIATQGRGWTDAPALSCGPAPALTVWLHGHTPSHAAWLGNWLHRGWVARWLGAYDLRTDLVNGRAVYARRDLNDSLLWFARSESAHPYWFLGSASDLVRAAARRV